MRGRSMCRRMLIAVLAGGVASFQWSPIVWAQLEDVDPALHAAVEALIQNDPSIASDPELAQLCRQVAEATVLDPRERSAVTNEVVAIHREGVDISTIIPTEVREAAREQFNQVQSQMREQLETLRATDPQRAQEVELMMQEGERCMLAFESGEQYTPSPEMVAHAEEMMHEWESDMVARGAPPEMIERARTEFAAWSSGDMTEMMGMMGPGHEMGGPGGMPTPEQMQAMVDAGQMTPEQFQMATEYMQQGGSEQFGPHEGFGPAPMEAYMPEGWAQDQSGEFHYVDMGGVTPEQYHEMMEQQYIEQYAPENQNYDNLQQQQFDQNQLPPPEGPHTNTGQLVDRDNNGLVDAELWDGNDADTVGDHFHEIGTPPHSGP